jgi:hypothetical protein
MTTAERIGFVLAALAAFVLTMPEASSDDFLSKKDKTLEVSESVLCGIDISRNTIEEALNRFGVPHSVTFTAPSKTTFAVPTYEWESRTSRLRITADPGGLPRQDGHSILRIDVWGAYPEGLPGITGRGLRLGDTAEDAKRTYRLPSCYGTTLFARGKPSLYPSSETFGQALEINFDSEGMINHFKLTKSISMGSY